MVLLGKWIADLLKLGLKVLFIIFLIFLLPRFFFITTVRANAEFKLGLENLSDKFLKDLGSARIGILTNQTGRDQKGNRNIDLLIKKGLNIKAIYVPEHGLDGKTLAEKFVANMKDKTTGLPVISLYPGNRPRKLNQEDLRGIDVLFFELQDSGMRHYTYIASLFEAMDAVKKFDKKIVVLDRPNPLGFCMEGPLVDEGLKSAVSIAPIPLRHAMTVGELALYFNKYFFENDVNLCVVPMVRYTRTQSLCGLFTSLSPNLASVDSCKGYSFLGLLGEFRPFDVAVGTTSAFQCILMPESLPFSNKKWQELQNILLGCEIESKYGRYLNKKNNQYYNGLKLAMSDINKISGFSTLIKVLEFFRDSGIQFTHAPILNKAVGTTRFVELLENKIPRQQFANKVNEDLEAFWLQAKDCFLYKPLPKIVKL